MLRRVLRTPPLLVSGLLIIGLVGSGLTACDSVNDALGGGRKQFTEAANSFATASSAYIDDVNALFDSGDKETYLTASTTSVDDMEAALQKMQRAVPDVSGRPRNAADDAVNAAEAMTAAAAKITAAVRTNDVDAAQTAAGTFEAQRTEFNHAVNSFKNAS